MHDRRSTKLIDMKIPLTWLLVSAISVGLSIGGLFNKVDTVTSALARLEKTIETRDEKLNTIVESISAVRSKTEVQQIQIERNSSDISEIKSNLKYVVKGK